MKPIFTILIALLLCQTLKAQTCTGSVGDPIVNITFGSGSSLIGPPLPPGTTTNLTFTSQDCPNDGEYSIKNYSGSCWSNSWHIITDHTGDPNGYFMLINASEEPSTFYTQTIDGLCTGTQYQFGAWILNLCNIPNSVRPNITFTIEKTDGTVLSRYTTGDVPISTANGVWLPYAFNFTTPDGTSEVVLRMSNSSPGGTNYVGNDFALDDITFRPIGPNVNISSSSITSDTTYICASDTKSLLFQSAVEQCYLTTAYQWQVSTDVGQSWSDIAGATSTTFERKQTPVGTYMYRLATAQKTSIGVLTCRVTSRPFTLIVYPPDLRTISIAALNKTICDSTPVTFAAQTTFAGNSPKFQWLLNGLPVGKSDSILTLASVNTNDKISCVLTSSLSCNSPAISNVVSVEVLKKAYATFDKTICEGDTYEGYAATGTYKDIFVGSNGCDSIRTLHLTAHPKQHTFLDTSICFGTSYRGLTRKGSYDFHFNDMFGCDSIHTVVLDVLPDIHEKPYQDTILCSGDSIVLSPGKFDTYTWQDGSHRSTLTIREAGTYRVTATNKCGTATKLTTVQEKACQVAFPMAFSPNGDGRNDIFRVVNGYKIAKFHFIVTDRWGQILFETNNPLKGWDGNINGRRANVGTYIWFCEYQNSEENRPNSIKGTVVLLR